MKLGQDACLGYCSDEFDGPSERSRAILALLFNFGGSSISYLNTVCSPLGFVACFLNLSFDVLSVIYRLQNIRSLSDFYYIQFCPLFSRLGHITSLILVPRPLALA
jgi:hypothetical protein